MKKAGILAGLVALALVVSLAGFGRGTPDVKAQPTDILLLNPTIVNVLSDAGCAPTCDLTVPADLLDVADHAGDNDGNVEPSDFADLDLDGDQLMETNGVLWVLAFVDDDDPVTIDPKAELSFVEDTVAPGDNNGDLECAAAVPDIVDEDCDSDGTAGDGVVVGTLVNSTASPGEVETIEAEQEGVFTAADVNVVGEPDEITLIALEDTVEEDGPACGGLDIGDFLDEAADPSVAGLTAVVEDTDGVALAGVFVGWDSDDSAVVDVTEATTLTLALPDGTFAVNLACGDDQGAADVTAEFDMTAVGGQAEAESVTITVIGAPADVIPAVDPLSITCDGVSTATVTASVVDANGDAVVDGTPVTFSVVALGTADPITATTVDGMASSMITPLSGVTAGVTVIISAGGTAQTSVLVECLEPVPTATPVPPPPPPTATPPGGITPPPTGSGGDLATAAGGGLSGWSVAGLAAAGMVLVTGGLATRRIMR